MAGIVLVGQTLAPARRAGRWPEHVDRQHLATQCGAVQLGYGILAKPTTPAIDRTMLTWLNGQRGMTNNNDKVYRKQGIRDN